MKSFKLIMFLFFSLVLGSQIGIAQQANTVKGEQYLPSKVTSNSRKKTKTNNKSRKTVSSAETRNLHSKAEKEARALTARKTKNSGKGNIPREQAEKERAARIAGIIEANKTKKKTPSKRKTKN